MQYLVCTTVGKTTHYLNASELWTVDQKGAKAFPEAEATAILKDFQGLEPGESFWIRKAPIA